MKPFIDIHNHHSPENVIGLRSYRLGVEDCKDASGPYSVGIHPWDVCKVECVPQLLADLGTMTCTAIGEIGLDKVCNADFTMQMEVFEQQVVIAHKRSLPIIIHCVKAQQSVANILANYPTPAVIFHGFIGSLQQAEQLWKNGYYLSFGFGTLRSSKTMEALRRCPAELLFLESDTTHNEPIDTLYEQVAQLRGVSTEELNANIHNNYNRIFK